MMGSLFSSISGLRNHTTWMNVIGNNISNVNTVGYKYQRVTFKEQITQMMGAASGANAESNLGGKNPQQMGLGAALGSIDTIMTQGAIQTTGNPLDVAITGEGFFTVKQGTDQYYTRAGNFYQDDAGNVTTAAGQIVQGWMGSLDRGGNTMYSVVGENPELQIRGTEYSIDTTDTSQIGNIQIPSDMTLAAQMTQFIKFSGNLDSNTPLNNYADTTNPPLGIGTPTVLPSNYSPNGAPTITTGSAININVGPAGQNVNQTATRVPGYTWVAGTDIAFFHTDPNNPNSAKVDPDHATTIEVYDSLGNPRSLTIWFFQHGYDIAGAGANDYRPVWDWYAFDTTFVQGDTILTGEPDYFNCVGGTNIDMQNANGADEVDVYSCIWFNPDGSLANNGDGWDLGVLPGAAAGAGPFTRTQHSQTIDGVTHYGPELYFIEQTHAQGIMPDGAASPWTITLDFGTPNSWDAGGALAGATGNAVVTVNNITNTQLDPAQPGLRDGLTGDVSGEYQTVGGVNQYVPNSNAYAKEQNGYRSGDLRGLTIDSTGGIVGDFTNDRSITIAQLAIATFANPQGLSKAGDSNYQQTTNSGLARFSTAGNAGSGTTVGGALEASNVDLSVELTNMIIAQRGFESNARIITTSADMLDTLVNVGR